MATGGVPMSMVSIIGSMLMNIISTETGSHLTASLRVTCSPSAV